MFRAIGRIIALAFILWAGFACKRDPNAILGNHLYGTDDLVAKYDTMFQIEAFSVIDDSLIVQNSSSVLLGTSFSPTFGSASYNLIVQLLTLRIDGDDSYTYYSGYLNESSLNSVDSVVLSLPYSGVFPLYGSMDGRRLSFRIYEVAEELVDGQGYDSAYSVNHEVAYSRQIGDLITVYPKPFDTVYDSVLGYKKVAPLKAYLSKDFGRELLGYVLGMTEEERADLASLPAVFKGLYFKMEPCAKEDESIVFSVSNLFSMGAELTVYFDGMEMSEGVYSTAYQKFILGPMRFTQVVRDRSLSTDDLYKKQMETEGDTASGAQRLYIEGSGGSRVRFRIPGFQNVVSGRVVINQAVLVAENVNSDITSDIDVPAQLHCIRYYNRGTEAEILDEINPGGTYSSTKGQYRVNITRYLQRLAYLTTVDTANRKLFENYLDLVPQTDERYEQPTRVVLYGPGAPERKMRLEVIYTIIGDTIEN
ncbi:MAG: DUF4270 domain-containing protein [Bacteroidales bacterium]|nr:DUF4270 domain-containing protein [Bacteroidales bacterium]MDE7073218.1 DUF4270 domain-containing protein [Bacteroidales bacterium]